MTSEQIRLKRPKPNSFEIPGHFRVPISSNSAKAAVSHNIIQADTNFCKKFVFFYSI